MGRDCNYYAIIRGHWLSLFVISILTGRTPSGDSSKAYTLPRRRARDEGARRLEEGAVSERGVFTSEPQQRSSRYGSPAWHQKARIVRFQTHFQAGTISGFGVTEHLAVPEGEFCSKSENRRSAPNDVVAVERVLGADRDVAAVMIEPVGSSSGAIPTSASVLRDLREITRKRGVLLIFDEVVTGFRVSPGGAQALYNVIPDLTTMAKIVAGGLPGGAVGGRKDILDLLDFDVTSAAGRERVSHQGTHNAHPVSAAAGIATLSLIHGSDVCAKPSATAATLRAGMNKTLAEEGIPWAIYGEHSFFHIYTNISGSAIRPTEFDATTLDVNSFKGKNERMLGKLRLAMLVNGVDLKGWRGGIVSAAHTHADVAKTLDAWRKSLRALKDEGELSRSTSMQSAALSRVQS